ncbi:MAG TPA: tandem-95 repeat protein, partial [Thermoanaerobaculia bacterium]|nr:tandem-95 repeat protein [Thermoanaerobaculia bacterium]
TPDADFHGTDSFTYTIGDGNGGTATATVTVTVTSVNDAPVVNDDAASVAEDGSVSVAVLTNDDDADDDPLTIASVTQGANGSVAIDGQSVIYTPNANFNGTDTFTYTVTDGNGGTATASVAITVTSGNDGPVATPDIATVAEEGAITVTVLTNDSDPESDPLQVTSVTQGADGVVAINGGATVTYKPDANFHGTDSFTYTIEDGNGGTATTTVTVTVTPVNDVPVANADAGSVAEDGSVAITVLTNDDDADGDTLSVTAATQGANGSATVNPDKTISYAPNPNFQGSDVFTYTVSDGKGGTATASVAITVTAVNDAPVANPNTATTPEDNPVIIAVLANDTDADGDILQVASVIQGTKGAVAINPDRTVTYTPNTDVSGSDSFTYTVSDGNGGTATAAVTLTVTAVNDAPVAVNDTAATTAEVLVNVTVLGNDVDVDGPSLTVTSVTQPAHGTTVVNADQTIRYTPASGYKGSDAFTYTVADGAGGTATATVTMTVNAPPRVTGNLQVLYNLNEGSGSTVTDSSGTGTPLNLTVSNPAAVSWISGGLSVNSATLIQSAGAATKVITACQASNAITIEAWVTPRNTSQTGPAPLVSISQASNKRNVTFGQSANRWDGRLRTSATNQAGNTVQTAVGTASTALSHVVYTRDSAGNIRIYVNGVQSTSSTLTGSFSAWTTSYKLGLVNELSTGAPWLGDLYLVAIYSRALSGTEVRQNWLAGQ